MCPAHHRHGTDNGCYTGHGCRCESCRGYAREYAFWLTNLHRAGKTPPYAAHDARGVRRRLEALLALGWTIPDVATRVGVNRALALRWLTATTVEAKTIERVSQVFTELCMQQPPTDTPNRLGIVNRTRALAASRGYLPPLAWDDIDTDDEPAEVEDGDGIDVVVIELAMQGRRVRPLTQQERHTAVRDLNARAYYDREIAIMLGVNEKTIARDRDALGIPAVDDDARDATHLYRKALAA